MDAETQERNMATPLTVPVPAELINDVINFVRNHPMAQAYVANYIQMNQKTMSDKSRLANFGFAKVCAAAAAKQTF